MWSSLLQGRSIWTQILQTVLADLREIGEEMTLAAQVLNNVSWLPIACVIGFAVSMLSVPAVFLFIPKDK